MKLLEIWCEDFAPESFLSQTPQTFAAALRGRVESRRRERELGLWVAYNAGLFSAGAQSKRGLLPFSSYARKLRGDNQASGTAAAAFNFFSSLKARGLPIELKRVTRH